MKKDIYIIKNSVNSKVYIGQAANAAERWLSHIYNARYEAKTNRNKQVLHRAMAKYGEDKFHYEILEYQITNYDEREQYWIKFYNSVVPNGYNIAPGGCGAGNSIESPCAIFKDMDTLLSCISEISGTSKTFTNIARKYQCSQEVISAINRGERYYVDGFMYPLRDTDTRYGEELVKQIRYSLKYETDLTLNDIAQKYGVDASQLSAINNGKKYYLKSEKYPLRTKRKTDFDNETVNAIVDDIINSELSMSDIAAKYNVSRSRITGINRGTYYKDINRHYPLRQDNDYRSKSLKKFLDRSIILEIHDMLRSGISAKDIANKYCISKATVHNINNGRCKKYLIDGVRYPIKPIS